MSNFKSEYEFEKRYNEAQRIRAKYSDRIPVIVSVDNSSPLRKSDLPLLDKNKFLVHQNLQISSLIFIIRKRMKLSQKAAIFLLIPEYNVVPVSTDLMSTVYSKYADKDGFLYIDIMSENVFG